MKKSIFIVLLATSMCLAGCSSDAGKISEIQAEENRETATVEVVEEARKPNEQKVPEAKSDVSANDMPVETDEKTALDESVKSEGVHWGNEDVTNDYENNQSVFVDSNAVEKQESDIEEELIVAENSLKIQGLVETDLSLSLEELKAMEDIIFEGDFYWLNSFGTTGHTHFKGVNLWKLLETRASIKSEATFVSVTAQDGYKMQFTIDQVKKQDYIDETNPDASFPIIVAWEENKEEYSTDKGAPFKLVVGQKEAGDTNKPQWVSDIDKIIVE